MGFFVALAPAALTGTISAFVFAAGLLPVGSFVLFGGGAWLLFLEGIGWEGSSGGERLIFCCEGSLGGAGCEGSVGEEGLFPSKVC